MPPPFLFDFLTDVNKPKEIRMDEGVGGGNGVLDGFEGYLGIKMDCIGWGGGGEGTFWAHAQAYLEY